ncbi:MAG TPA: Panacea domain-containing protein [Rhodocyclaceae bacterium]|nr:Panacea domain-containing protein [Rhodocyclaceae bacterium]
MANANRNRLINAIVFFAENTQHCGKIKLFKLLYLLDFENFRQTGKSVTGFEYQAWKFGPVPFELMEEWEEFGPDMAQAIRIEPEKIYDHTRMSVRVNEGVAFDPEDFTPRQLRIMEELATKYRTNYSLPMVELTHEENGAWDKVWHNGAGAQKVIPYDLAVGDVPERDEVLSVAAERAMYQAALEAARNAATA